MSDPAKGIVAVLIVVASVVFLAALVGLKGVAEYNRTVRSVDEKWEKLLIEKGHGTYKEGKFTWKEDR